MDIECRLTAVTLKCDGSVVGKKVAKIIIYKFERDG